MKKKLLILIPIIIALILAVTALLLLKNKPATPHEITQEELVANVIKTNPELNEQEVKDFFNTPLTQEQQQQIQQGTEEFEEIMDVRVEHRSRNTGQAD